MTIICGETNQVAKIPPAVPKVTTYAVETERKAGPAALFASPKRGTQDHLGIAPMVMRKNAAISNHWGLSPIA